MSDSGDISGLTKDAALLSWIQRFAPYGVVTLDKTFVVQTWNHWMEMHSAWPAAEVRGKNLFDLFPDLRQRKLAAPFERALLGEASVLSTALHHYLLALPSPIQVEGEKFMRQTARVAPLLEGVKVCGVVVVIEDVTQREAQAEALHRQHRRDEMLSWTLGHLLQADDPRKTIRQVFFKIAEHFDLDTFFLYIRDLDTEVLNLYTAGGVPLHLDQEFTRHPLLSTAAETPEIVVFESLPLRTEPEFLILQKALLRALIAIPLFANDRSLGLLCFGTASRETIAADEIDQLKLIAQYLAIAVDRENTNQQLRKVREQLLNHAKTLEEKVEERTARLQETIAELETFSYTLAHDLKAPVRGMIGYCEVLLEDFGPKLPPDARHILEKLAHTPKRMHVLIQNLLEFSKVSRQEVRLSRVEVEPILDDIVAMRAPAVRQAISVDMPLRAVLGHAALLQQVLSNLVDNAVKFVDAGHQPKIRVYTEVVSHTSMSTRSRPLLFSATEPVTSQPAVATLEEPKRVRIWVVDQGIGIPMEAHQKIFGIFERAVSMETFEGTGMGLAIVARAMQRMGGTCGVESQPGQGSSFWIELPAA